ncbi:MAG: hypothetical protein M0Q12_06135 [Synergistaceae bacterium]|jgi:hypothetical protein|nr:hypothetical protein [Synergistaceae bacterium]
MKTFLLFIFCFQLSGSVFAQDSTQIDITFFPSTVRPKSLIIEKVTAEYDNQYVYVNILNFTGIAFIEIKNAAGASVSRIKAGINNAATVYIPIDNFKSGEYTIYVTATYRYYGVLMM